MAVEELAAASGLSAGRRAPLKRLEATGLGRVDAAPAVRRILPAGRTGWRRFLSSWRSSNGRTKPARAGGPGRRVAAGLRCEGAPRLPARWAAGIDTGAGAQAAGGAALSRGALLREDRPYAEREVNERARRVPRGRGALRRSMVVAGLMTRAGGEYGGPAEPGRAGLLHRRGEHPVVPTRSLRAAGRSRTARSPELPPARVR